MNRKRIFIRFSFSAAIEQWSKGGHCRKLIESTWEASSIRVRHLSDLSYLTLSGGLSISWPFISTRYLTPLLVGLFKRDFTIWFLHFITFGKMLIIPTVDPSDRTLKWKKNTSRTQLHYFWKNAHHSHCWSFRPDPKVEKEHIKNATTLFLEKCS